MNLTGCVVCDSDPKPFHANMRPRPMGEVAGRPVHLSCKHEAEYALTCTEITVSPTGVVTWDSNGRHPFADMIRKAKALGVAGWDAVDEAATEVARDADTAAFLKAYAAAQPAEPSAEERFEMLAAFGPGETVVDVFTGRRVTL